MTAEHGVTVEPIPMPTWKGSGVTVGDVTTAVEELRRNETSTATRTSVATLIAVARDQADMDDIDSVIEHLGVRHPARIVTLLVPKDAGQGDDRIDAEVRLHAGEAAGHAIWSDEIRLDISGGPARHLASLIRPLQLADLPVVVWYVRGLPDSGDPLLKMADAVIVNTKGAIPEDQGEAAMYRGLEQIGTLIRRHTIVDLSWHRLRTWRKLTAALFDGQVYRPFVAGVESVEIAGKLGPRTLLAGWLAERLRLQRDQLSLSDARHVGIKLHARVGDQTAEFSVERVEGERLVRASAVIAGGPSHSELLGLPDQALPLSLSSALKRLERDKSYEQTIKLVGTWS